MATCEQNMCDRIMIKVIVYSAPASWVIFRHWGRCLPLCLASWTGEWPEAGLPVVRPWRRSRCWPETTCGAVGGAQCFARQQQWRRQNPHDSSMRQKDVGPASFTQAQVHRRLSRARLTNRSDGCLPLGPLPRPHVLVRPMSVRGRATLDSSLLGLTCRRRRKYLQCPLAKDSSLISLYSAHRLAVDCSQGHQQRRSARIPAHVGTTRRLDRSSNMQHDRPGFWPERGKRGATPRMIAASIKLVRGTALHSDRVANPRIVISFSQKASRFRDL